MFESKPEERVQRQVGSYRRKRTGDQFQEIAGGPAYAGRFRSAIVNARATAGEDRSIVHVGSCCARGLKNDPRGLSKYLLTENAGLLCGAFSLDACGSIRFATSIRADDMSLRQFERLLAFVAATADTYDHKITSRFGGVTGMQEFAQGGWPTVRPDD